MLPCKPTKFNVVKDEFFIIINSVGILLYYLATHVRIYTTILQFTFNISMYKNLPDTYASTK